MPLMSLYEMRKWKYENWETKQWLDVPINEIQWVEIISKIDIVIRIDSKIAN